MEVPRKIKALRTDNPNGASAIYEVEPSKLGSTATGAGVITVQTIEQTWDAGEMARVPAFKVEFEDGVGFRYRGLYLVEYYPITPKLKGGE